MDLAGILTLLTLVEERAKNARVMLTTAVLLDQEARAPRLAIAGAPVPPSASQAAQHAQQMRHVADANINDLIRFAMTIQRNGKPDGHQENPSVQAEAVN